MIGTARILRRVWQIYTAHLLLFLVLMAEIAFVTTITPSKHVLHCTRWSSRTSSSNPART